MGDHETVRIDESHPRGGSDPGSGEVPRKILKRDVGADHAFAVCAPLSEGRADLLRGEEHVRSRPHGRGARQGLAVPLPGPGIEVVVGSRLVAEHAEARIEKEVPSLGGGAALDQEGGLRWRTEALPRGRVTQRAHEEEVAAAEAHVDGGDLGVFGEGGGQHGKGFESRAQAARAREPVSGQELDEEVGGGQEVPDVAGRATRPRGGTPRRRPPAEAVRWRRTHSRRWRDRRWR